MDGSLPAVFVSHGSPMLVIEDGAAHRFLRGYGAQLDRPKAVLAVSAHWETPAPLASTAVRPDTIHDFGGFARELYAMRYPAPGAPEVAERAAELLTAAGIPAGTDPRRGLDHGAWVPLTLLYPDADIPVTQLSIQPHLGPEHHWRVGQALRPLRDDGVLILATGAITHNLREFFGRGLDSGAPDWVTGFADWIADAVATGRTDDLLDYRRLAPHAVRNHPTDEHLLPLFVAAGAGSEGHVGAPLHRSHTYGVLAMDAYAFA